MTLILVIDHHEIVSKTIVEFLQSNSYQVLHANNGQVGIELIQKVTPDLIVCDIGTPDLSGYEVLDWLNQHSILTIPFIFLTIQDDKESLRKAMNLGADDCLIKPFEMNELLSVITTRLQKHHNIIANYQTQINLIRRNIVGSIPHEMRIPLTQIVSYTELIQLDIERLNQQEILEMTAQVLEAAWRLRDVIEKYLLYIKIEILYKTQHKSAYIMAESVDYLLLVVNDVASQLGIKYKQKLAVEFPTTSPTIFIDPKHLKIILHEVIDNACKFAYTDTTVQIKVLIDDKQVRVSVENQGRGMTLEQINMIGAFLQFDRKDFEQVGVGLGLVIAKDLISIYNGFIVVDSNLNENTTITLSFPLEK
jgi:two-component system, sensor histidine kinase and response regulator